MHIFTTLTACIRKSVANYDSRDFGICIKTKLNDAIFGDLEVHYNQSFLDSLSNVFISSSLNQKKEKIQRNLFQLYEEVTNETAILMGHIVKLLENKFKKDRKTEEENTYLRKQLEEMSRKLEYERMKNEKNLIIIHEQNKYIDRLIEKMKFDRTIIHRQ